MFSNLFSTITQGIRVNVRPYYLQNESSPKHQFYFFAYQVEIVNESAEEVQLFSRYWKITDGYGQKRKVEGEGVVGQQPILGPGDFHEYVSGCDFPGPIGMMEGYYTMRKVEDGSEFRVKIPPFVMTAPVILN